MVTMHWPGSSMMAELKEIREEIVLRKEQKEDGCFY
jgi:hypothetical protein